MPGDGSVTELAWERSVGKVADALAEVFHTHTGHDVLLDIDGRDTDFGHHAARHDVLRKILRHWLWRCGRRCGCGRHTGKDRIDTHRNEGSRCGAIEPAFVDDLLKVAAQCILCSRFLNCRAPQLVGDEGKHQQTDGDQRPTDVPDDPTPIAWLGRPVPS